MEDNFDDDENDFQWLIDGDEDILDVQFSEIDDGKDELEPGIVLTVGDESSGFEIVFTESDLKKMLKIVQEG